MKKHNARALSTITNRDHRAEQVYQNTYRRGCDFKYGGNPFGLGIQPDEAKTPKISTVFRPKDVKYTTGYKDLKKQFAERYDYIYKY